MELPAYSVQELNEAIGVLLERGFAPRFLVEGAVIKPVLKKGTCGSPSVMAMPRSRQWPGRPPCNV